jgi:hypothetical protein
MDPMTDDRSLEASEECNRRAFLCGVKNWSGVVAELALALGDPVASPDVGWTNHRGAWIEARGVVGWTHCRGRWINGAGGINRRGGWLTSR